MPTYEYECEDCGVILDIFHGINEVIDPMCQSCGKSSLKKLISGGIGVHFKGSGFYVTDKNPKKTSTDTKKSSDATTSKDS